MGTGMTGVENLRYRIPQEQDPVVLVEALNRDGYEATMDQDDGERYLVVPCPAGRDRERPRVRAVVGDVHTTGLEGQEFRPGEVVFEDEK